MYRIHTHIYMYRIHTHIVYSDLATGFTSEESCFDSRQKQWFDIFLEELRTALGSSQPPTESIPEKSSPGKGGWSLMITTHLHLGPRLRTNGTSRCAEVNVTHTRATDIECKESLWRSACQVSSVKDEPNALFYSDPDCPTNCDQLV